MDIEAFRAELIAECSFTIMGKGADAITIGDVRGIADRIIASIRSEGFAYAALRGIKPFDDSGQDTKQIVAHGDGADLAIHSIDQPCALCRPPIEITDEMVERALSSFDALGWHLPSPSMRAALEAALNG